MKSANEVLLTYPSNDEMGISAYSRDLVSRPNIIREILPTGARERHALSCVASIIVYLKLQLIDIQNQVFV